MCCAMHRDLFKSQFHDFHGNHKISRSLVKKPSPGEKAQKWPVSERGKRRELKTEKGRKLLHLDGVGGGRDFCGCTQWVPLCL